MWKLSPEKLVSSQGSIVSTQQSWDLKLGLTGAQSSPSFKKAQNQQQKTDRKKTKTNQDAHAKPGAKEQVTQHRSQKGGPFTKITGSNYIGNSEMAPGLVCESTGSEPLSPSSF